MDTLGQTIISEVEKLRKLKKTVFRADFKSCDITASDICFSADVLLVPLYWYWRHHYPDETDLKIEDYLEDSINTFGAKASTIVPRLLARTSELDMIFKTCPFRSYRELLSNCFSSMTTSQNK